MAEGIKATRKHATWDQVRDIHRDRWVLIEATRAHSIDGRRIVEEVSVVRVADQSQSLLEEYLRLHRSDPARELYVYHTGRPTLDIGETRWAGIRATG